MNKKISVSLVVAIILVAITTTFSMTFIFAQEIFNKNIVSLQEKSATYEKLAKLDVVARNNFYGEINDEILLDTISAGYIAGLGDKNSKYYSKTQYSSYLASISSEASSVGVEIIKDTASGYARVVEVYALTTAADAGIVKNDFITHINDIGVKGLTQTQINAMLKDFNEEKITVTYLTGATNEEKTVDLAKRTHTIPTVTSELIGSVGYMKLSNFNGSTPMEFETQIQDLVSNGAESFVFDVRNNTSSDLDSVQRVLDMLLPSGVIAKGEYRNIGGAQTTIKTLYTSDAREMREPMVVLVNENTASGAELFAVDLQETDKAEIVGVETAGIGTIQEIFPQTDGSAMQITVARLLTSENNYIDGIGVIPDFGAVLSEEQQLEWYSLTTANDPQIIRAVSIAENLARGTGANPTDTIVDADSTIKIVEE